VKPVSLSGTNLCRTRIVVIVGKANIKFTVKSRQYGGGTQSIRMQGEENQEAVKDRD